MIGWLYDVRHFNIQQGEKITVSVDLESREYNGRWYTDVKAWKVSRDGSDANISKSFSNQDRNAPPITDMSSLNNDDIPF